MIPKKWWLAAAALLLAAAPGWPQTSNPTPKNFRLVVDGVDTGGVQGYDLQIGGELPVTVSVRRLDAPALPRRLRLTLTSKGLAALMGWLNDFTGGGSPAAKTVRIDALSVTGDVVASWQLTGVVPTAFETLSGGAGNVTATADFSFDSMVLLSAKAE
jgi:hypothetical protein